MVLVLVLAVRLAVGRLTHARDAVLVVVAWSVRRDAHVLYSIFRVPRFRLWKRASIMRAISNEPNYLLGKIKIAGVPGWYNFFRSMMQQLGRPHQHKYCVALCCAACCMSKVLQNCCATKLTHKRWTTIVQRGTAGSET